MSTFKFIQRKNKSALNKDNSSIIFLRYCHRSKSTLFSTSISIPVSNWDQKGQRIRKSYRANMALNAKLNQFRQNLENIVNKACFDNIDPSVDYVRSRFVTNLSSATSIEQPFMDFEDFTKYFILQSKLTKKASTIRSYNDVVNILELYKRSRRLRCITYEMFNQGFYNDFFKFYVYERGCSNNTFGKMVKTLKTILNAAFEKGFNNHTSYKKFKVYQEDVPHIYLDEKEILSIYKLKLDKDIRLGRIRNHFIIGCYTGLRVSDYNQITEENISNGRLTIVTQKTGTTVKIPLHPMVREIIRQYNGNLPKPYASATINKGLKTLAYRAGLKDNVVKVTNHGKNRKREVFKKWQLVSSHCARRSFATNLFKQGFPAISIMKITGHKSEKTFMKYIRVTEDETASMLERHWDSYYNKSA